MSVFVAVDGDSRPHSVPPGAHGGTIDLLTVGSSLSVPVQVEGALADVGDAHFTQGDGEVALTAMEASLRARVRAAITLLRARYGMDHEHTDADLSAATGVNSSQVVDIVKGVHARVRKADFHA